MKKYLLKDLSSGKILFENTNFLLNEINRDRSDEWQDYNHADNVLEAWEEWCQGDCYDFFTDISELRILIHSCDCDTEDFLVFDEERSFLEIGLYAPNFAYLEHDCDTQILKKELEEALSGVRYLKNIALTGEGDSSFSLFLYFGEK